jgi:hypothetical protein
MANKFLLVILFVLTAYTGIAQKPLTEDVVKNKLLTPYDNYFSADREIIYTQFNKSRYLTGDDIWFTSWVLNSANKQLSFNTTKLYVELWSAERKLISRKIFFVKGGTASNYIHVEDSLAAGTYCFRAYTSLMRNFYDEKEFNTPITILAPTVKSIKSSYTAKKVVSTTSIKETSIPDIRAGYDIQFLPESGHFIEGIDNVFGVKITDAYGHGISTKGKVVDSLNTELALFATNQMGMTNFTIIDAPNSILRVITELPDGSNSEIKLTRPEKQGVAINVNAYLKDVTWIRLQTNTLTRSLNQSYILMIHSDGNMYKNLRISFTNEASIQMKLNKKDLGNGIIYATLFNEDLTPIAERIFYNQNTPPKGKLSLTALSLPNDSVQLTVSASDSSSKAQIAKFSFSILPRGTLMNSYTTSLFAESRLRPSLKGDIENVGYYFENNNTKHLLALDNMMMTQGWRKYDWQEISKMSKTQLTYPAETAFTIEGSVKNWLKNKPEMKSRIIMISPQNHLLKIVQVDAAGKFRFPNLYLEDSSFVIASASSVKGANWNRVLQMSIPESTLKSPDFIQIPTPPVKQDEKIDDIPSLTKGVIRLAEVVVTAKKKNPFRDNIYVGIMSRQFELTKDNYKQYTDIEQVLMSFFNVMVTHDDSGNYMFNMGRGTTGRPQNPIMTIDGMRVQEPIEILSYPLNMIEAIAVDKSGTSGGGMGGGAGSIAITTRTTPLFEMAGESTNLKRLIVNGYTAPKAYFEPKYLIQPINPDFSKYAAIYWKPEVVTDSTGTASFRFIVPQPIKSIKVRAEGINFFGLIFLHDETLALPGRKNEEN